MEILSFSAKPSSKKNFSVLLDEKLAAISEVAFAVQPLEINQTIQFFMHASPPLSVGRSPIIS